MLLCRSIILVAASLMLLGLPAPAAYAQGLPVRTLPTPTEAMDWAERAFPHFFPSRQKNQSFPPYIYRYYPETGNHLGIDGDTVAVLGPMSGGQLAVVGKLADYACQISPRHCAPTGSSRLLAGNGFSVAVKDDGTVLKWGSRMPTEGPTVPNSTAIKVANLSGITSITGNDESGAVFALAVDGSVHSWGNNEYGALGTPRWVVDRFTSPNTNLAVGPVRSVAIAGVAHRLLTIFLRADGTVGFTPSTDFFGTQVHVGSVPGLNDVVALSDSHAADDFPGTKVHAIKADGTVWKLNWSEATVNRSPQYALSAVQVNGLASIVQVACGSAHCLARDRSGGVWAWGEEGALGNGSIGGHLLPFKVNGLPPAKLVAVGYRNSFVITTTGALYGWGRLDLDGPTYGPGASDLVVSPVLIVDSRYGVVEVSSSPPALGHVLLSLADGSVWSWGDNFYGQLGDGTTDRSRTIVRVQGVSLRP